MAALAAGIGIIEVGCSIASVFKDSKRNAKLAGALLACTLALREPFHSQSVSLVGFSLGCQVTKSCLKTLSFLGATDVIQNVTFMGAAIDKMDKSKTRVKMASVLSNIVAGEIKNVWTKKDWILAGLYTPCEGALAMGRDDVYPE